MVTVAVIPVHGRLPLLKITLQRLYNKNGVGHIICIGETEEERQVCNSQGCEFLKHQNKPLGKKWNAGFMKAKEHKPDAVVYVGSSDWLSDNWLPVLLPFIKEGYFMIGKPDVNLLHIGKEMKIAWWPHYSLGTGRENELIGAGRILSSEFLDRIDWQPFDDYLNNSMDFSMWKKLANLQKDGVTPVACYNLHEIQSLAISCDKWNNMHSNDYDLPNVIPFAQPEMWLKKWFPEALKLELNEV